jgi:phosphoribosylanthranilate isomerase
MTWVKICGITNLEDALLAVEAGADAVGFVFHEKSPRKVDVETARAIVAAVPDRVEKVGVFVEQGADSILEIAERTGLTIMQVPIVAAGEVLKTLAGGKSKSPKLVVAIPADKIQESFSIGEPLREDLYAALIDSGSAAAPGGTGTTFDWQKKRDILRRIALTIPVVIAGGLRPANVSEAIGTFRSFGVDVASGVEARPGKKDPEKMRAFVRAVRETDQKVV